jgi:hypothetical protein
MYLMFEYHKGGGKHDYWSHNEHDTFDVPGADRRLTSAQFGNYIVGWAAARVPSSPGAASREVGATWLSLQLVLKAGEVYDLKGDVHLPLDWDSKPYIYWGFLNGMEGLGADPSSSLQAPLFFRSDSYSTLWDGENQVRYATALGGWPLPF